MENIIGKNNLTCKYCQSESVIKYGKYKEVQRYFCKSCNRKFVSGDTIPKMQNTTRNIADALNMYYEGMSLNEIRRNFIQQDDNRISKVSAYNWVKRFTELAKKETDKCTPKVGQVWVADETVLDIDGQNVWFWDIIDSKTRFLLASHMSFKRTTADARTLIEKAMERAGMKPRVIITDRLRAYIHGIKKSSKGIWHKRGAPFTVENNTNLIERFHGTIKERTKVMRGLHTVESARAFMDGWLIHYNFFRPHISLNDRTPAQKAKINFPFHNWKEIVEQPYGVTAKIPIKPKPRVTIITESAPVSVPKARAIRISPRMPRISPRPKCATGT